jgi:uncharacterized lipoprotein
MRTLLMALVLIVTGLSGCSSTPPEEERQLSLQQQRMELNYVAVRHWMSQSHSTSYQVPRVCPHTSGMGCPRH